MTDHSAVGSVRRSRHRSARGRGAGRSQLGDRRDGFLLARGQRDLHEPFRCVLETEHVAELVQHDGRQVHRPARNRPTPPGRGGVDRDRLARVRPEHETAELGNRDRHTGEVDRRLHRGPLGLGRHDDRIELEVVRAVGVGAPAAGASAAHSDSVGLRIVGASATIAGASTVVWRIAARASGVASSAIAGVTVAARPDVSTGISGRVAVTVTAATAGATGRSHRSLGRVAIAGTAATAGRDVAVGTEAAGASVAGVGTASTAGLTAPVCSTVVPSADAGSVGVAVSTTDSTVAAGTAGSTAGAGSIAATVDVSAAGASALLPQRSQRRPQSPRRPPRAPPRSAPRPPSQVPRRLRRGLG